MPDLEFMSASDVEAYTSAFETAVPTHALKAIDIGTGYLGHMAGGGETASGVSVNQRMSLRVGAILACVRVIAEDVGKLPLHLNQYSRDADDRPVTTTLDNHAAALLLREPNEYMTAQDFIETMTAVAALRGTAYAQKIWVNDRLEELWPLLPGQCVPRRDLWESRRELWFDIWTSAEGGICVPAEDVVRIKGPSLDGFEGLDMVHQASEIIGLSSQIVRAQARFYGKDQRPSGILTSKMPLSNKEHRERIAQQWTERFGPGGDGGVAVLDADFSYAALNVSAADADTMKLWEAAVAEACRMFRVSPAKVMQSTGSVSYNSLEQTNANHLTDTMEPWLIRWEQALGRDLLTREQRLGKRGKRLAFFFVRDEYLRPLPKDMMEMDVKAIQTGIMTRNEVRERRDLPRFPDAKADDLFAPLPTNPGGSATTAKIGASKPTPDTPPPEATP